MIFFTPDSDIHTCMAKPLEGMEAWLDARASQVVNKILDCNNDLWCLDWRRVLHNQDGRLRLHQHTADSLTKEMRNQIARSQTVLGAREQAHRNLAI